MKTFKLKMAVNFVINSGPVNENFQVENGRQQCSVCEFVGSNLQSYYMHRDQFCYFDAKDQPFQRRRLIQIVEFFSLRLRCVKRLHSEPRQRPFWVRPERTCVQADLAIKLDIGTTTLKIAAKSRCELGLRMRISQQLANINHTEWVIDLSCIPVNKGTNSRLGWIKYSDLYMKLSTRALSSFFHFAYWSGMRERSVGVDG